MAPEPGLKICEAGRAAAWANCFDDMAAARAAFSEATAFPVGAEASTLNGGGADLSEATTVADPSME